MHIVMISMYIERAAPTGMQNPQRGTRLLNKNAFALLLCCGLDSSLI